jgi:glycosyltransferase involved in cell wall biosynthesis
MPGAFFPPRPEPPNLTRTAVIIPARNEAANIAGVVMDIHAHLPDADVIVVDDHSDDETRSVASALPGVVVVPAPICLGIGAAVQLGVRYALAGGYDIFIRMDGDGQHRADCLPGLVGSRSPGTLVQGARTDAQFLATSNWARRLGSLYFRSLFRVFTRGPVQDPTSGFMCFDRGIAAKFSRFYPSDFPEIESLVLLLRSGHRVVSVPVSMAPRKHGTSSIDSLHALVYMFSVTVAFFGSFLRKNPYRTPDAH